MQSKTTVKKYFQERQEQLPYNNPPTPSRPTFFYKARQKISSGYHTIRIGLLLCSYKHFQQDYICYFGQYLAAKCSFLKIYIVGANHFYMESSFLVQENQQLTIDDICLQANILHVMTYACKIFKIFMDSDLNGQYLLSNQFHSDDIIKKFEKQVVRMIQLKYKQLMSHNRF